MSYLEEALQITSGDRARDYGTPLINHLRIAVRWNILLGARLEKPINPADVVLMMIDLKIAREQQTHKDDNFVDIAGYINCLDKMHLDMVRLGFNSGIEKFKEMSFDDLTNLLRCVENEQRKPATGGAVTQGQSYTIDATRHVPDEWTNVEEQIIKKLSDTIRTSRIDVDK